MKCPPSLRGGLGPKFCLILAYQSDVMCEVTNDKARDEQGVEQEISQALGMLVDLTVPYLVCTQGPALPVDGGC